MTSAWPTSTCSSSTPRRRDSPVATVLFVELIRQLAGRRRRPLRRLARHGRGDRIRPLRHPRRGGKPHQPGGEPPGPPADPTLAVVAALAIHSPLRLGGRAATSPCLFRAAFISH